MSSGSLWTPLDAGHVIDPFPMYRRLREQEPFYKASTGEIIVSRYEDVKAILKDGRFIVGNKKHWIEKGINYFRNHEKDFTSIASAIDSFILLIDPPRHTILRRFIQKAWSDKDVHDLINKNIIYLIKNEFKGGEIDLVLNFARPLPSMTIASILGVPLEDCHKLQKLGFDLVKALDLYNKLDDLVRMESSASELVGYFLEHVDKLDSNGSDGSLIKRIVSLNQKEKILDRNEIASICIFLLIAGQETTVGLIGTGLFHLHQNPDQRKKLIEDPGIISLGIEELLRYDGPVHMLGRIVSEDMEINGHYFKTGETVTLCLASANRDDLKFEDAQQLIVDRRDNPHIAFGSGIHHCLGDWLAKIQGKLAIEAIFRNYPSFEILDDKPRLNNNISIRTLTSLPARLN